MITKRHIRVHHYCGACGFQLQWEDRFVAVCRKENGNLSAINLGAFPKQQGYADLGEFIRCERTDCSSCDEASECAVFHQHCYQLFRLRCDAENGLFCLWTAGCWKNPTRDLRLVLEPLPDSRSAMDAVMETPFATEINNLIWDLVPREKRDLWFQLQCASELACFISSHEDHGLESVPLCEIGSWHRGLPRPERADPAERLAIRLIADSRGLLRIDRLTTEQARGKDGYSSSRYAFAKVSADDCSGITAQFLYGLGRLKFPQGYENRLHFWNTADPLPLPKCPSPRGTNPSQLFSLPLSRSSGVTGITVFVDSFLGHLLGIHAHTRAAPTASTTFDRIPAAGRHSVVWAYTPFPRDDELLAFGVRWSTKNKAEVYKCCFLFQMARAGLILCGNYQDAGSSEEIICEASPQTLIYSMDTAPTTADKTGPFRPMIMGVHPVAEKAQILEEPSDPERYSFWETCYSFASLDKVSSLKAFYEHPEWRAPRFDGLLIEYEDGSSRAVGECKVGVVEPRVYKQPTRLCHQVLELADRSRITTAVEVGEEEAGRHDHVGVGWECHGISGTLECWFTTKDVALRVTSEESLVPSSS